MRLIALLLLLTTPLAAQSVPCKTVTATRAAIGKDSVQVQVTARCKLLRDTLRITRTDTLRLPGKTDTLYLPAPKDSTPPVVEPPKDTVVVPPPGKVGYRANEPTGLTTITDNNLSAPKQGGWFVDLGSASGSTDPTASVSPPGVIVGVQRSSGGAPFKLEYDFARSYSTVYFSLTFKLSANFQGEPSGTNKLLFLRNNGGPQLFLSTEGAGSGPLVPTMRVQSSDKDYPRQFPGTDYTSAISSLSRGAYHTWEGVVTSSGTLTWWIDGKPAGRASGAPITGGNFIIAELYPIWGGNTGATPPAGQSITFDHLYLSGK